MNVENIKGLIILRSSDESKKITNSKREFFSDLIYLSKNDSIDNYEEVGEEIWGKFINNEVSNFELLENRIDEQDSSILSIEDMTLDIDYKLLLLEIKLNNLEGKDLSKSTFTLVNYSMIRSDKLYSLLNKRIKRCTYTSKEEMQEMLNIYHFVNRINSEQYDELISSLAL